jgi:hypothetical protein
MKITLTHLSTSNLNTLAERTITTSEKTEYVVVKDHPLLVILKTVQAKYFAVYGKQTFSGMGNDVVQADALRDASFSGIKGVLLGFSKVKGYEFQQEAKDLYAIFEQRGLDLDTYSYADETTEMDKLIVELDTPANLAKLAHMNLTVPFGLMKTAQTAFKAVYLSQVSANAQLRKMESATSLRNNLERALRNYLNVVEAMKSMDGWTDLYLELSEIVRAARNNTVGGDIKTATTTPTATNQTTTK